jgi:hypothetical protein
MLPIQIGVVFLISTAGCEWRPSGTAGWNKPKEAEQLQAHDPDDVPITEADVDMPADFGAAVNRLVEYARRIKTAIKDGTPTKAHRPLDEADIVIGKIMGLARASGVPKQEWEEINLARRAVREQQDRLHAAIDAGETAPLAEVEPRLDEALRVLQTAADRNRGE